MTPFEIAQLATQLMQVKTGLTHRQAVQSAAELYKLAEEQVRTVKGLPQKDRIRGALIAYKQEGV